MNKQQIKQIIREELENMLCETGEMSQSDIESGGEHYLWAQAMENETKRIEKLTRGRLKFIQMKPFDKYRGPYAEVKIDGDFEYVWTAEDPNLLYFENREWAGLPEELACAINGDPESIRQVEREYKRSK